MASGIEGMDPKKPNRNDFGKFEIRGGCLCRTRTMTGRRCGRFEGSFEVFHISHAVHHFKMRKQRYRT